MSESEFLPEGTLRGMPGPLPAGERILWRGAPTWRGVLVQVFHLRPVVAWFAGTATLFGIAAAAQGGMVSALSVVAPTLLIGVGGIALLTVLAWLVHRTTVYTVTDRRVVMHVGIALPITLNLPHAQIEGAGLHLFGDGSGDIPLQLPAGERIAYLHLWPHARPWRVSRPEPMLRSVPDARAVAETLAGALAARGPRIAEGVLAVPSERPRHTPQSGRLAAAG
ncbi:photosynthetic complex putative assembly protein PuhB [Methylorubrum salsuginis]|uniref:PH domain-containing protein n=1 Tax=Methylorubrum salsuginis TaxID=414703 RepID=A0A1I4GMX9_9HYPH|nr:photosynthetic complex putative assembly protein PuhB [Methylorubrum salsuginis]SFL30486.1 PH domain-containing protein [Methylorubrum salsuginis]